MKKRVYLWSLLPISVVLASSASIGVSYATHVMHHTNDATLSSNGITTPKTNLTSVTPSEATLSSSASWYLNANATVGGTSTITTKTLDNISINGMNLNEYTASSLNNIFSKNVFIQIVQTYANSLSSSFKSYDWNNLISNVSSSIANGITDVNNALVVNFNLTLTSNEATLIGNGNGGVNLFNQDVTTGLNNCSLTIQNLAIDLTANDYNYLTNLITNNYRANLANIDLTQINNTNLLNWQTNQVWTFNSNNITSDNDNFINYLSRTLFNSTQITSANNEYVTNSPFIGISLNATDSSNSSLATNLSNVSFTNVTFTNASSSLLIYPNGVYINANQTFIFSQTGNSNTLNNFNGSKITLPYGININNLNEIVSSSTASFNYYLNNLTLKQNPYYYLTPFQTYNLAKTTPSDSTFLLNYYASILAINNLKATGATPSVTQPMQNDNYPNGVQFTLTLTSFNGGSNNRFYDYVDKSINNSLNYYLVNSQIYNTFDLANITSSLLSDSSTSGFNSFYYYNLNSTWLPSTINLKETYVTDSPYRINTLAKQSNTIWNAVVNSAISQLESSNNNWYSTIKPSSLLVGSDFKTEIKNNNLYLLVPITNNSASSYLVNQQLINPNTTSYVSVLITGYIVTVNGLYVLYALLGLLGIFMLIGLMVYLIKNKQGKNTVSADVFRTTYTNSLIQKREDYLTKLNKDESKKTKKDAKKITKTEKDEKKVDKKVEKDNVVREKTPKKVKSKVKKTPKIKTKKLKKQDKIALLNTELNSSKNEINHLIEPSFKNDEPKKVSKKVEKTSKSIKPKKKRQNFFKWLFSDDEPNDKTKNEPKNATNNEPNNQEFDELIE